MKNHWYPNCCCVVCVCEREGGMEGRKERERGDVGCVTPLFKWWQQYWSDLALAPPMFMERLPFAVLSNKALHVCSSWSGYMHTNTEKMGSLLTRIGSSYYLKKIQHDSKLLHYKRSPTWRSLVLFCGKPDNFFMACYICWLYKAKSTSIYLLMCCPR